jgi:hypothetical protein
MSVTRYSEYNKGYNIKGSNKYVEISKGDSRDFDINGYQYTSATRTVIYIMV